MKITLLCIGKTDEAYLATGIDKYAQRLKHYIPFQLVTLPDIKNTKNLSANEQKAKEATLILKQISNTDTVALLDEQGKSFRSKEFAGYLEKKSINSVQHLVFVIGGPYGFDPSIYARANDQLSLSKMTFSHQMIRLFFTEQLYRAYSILRGGPYHHE